VAWVADELDGAKRAEMKDFDFNTRPGSARSALRCAALRAESGRQHKAFRGMAALPRPDHERSFINLVY
jgi:hypothetical protein